MGRTRPLITRRDSLIFTALAGLILLARCGGGGGDTKKHLRNEYSHNPDYFEKRWGVGPGTDKPMPGKDRYGR